MYLLNCSCESADPGNSLVFSNTKAKKGKTHFCTFWRNFYRVLRALVVFLAFLIWPLWCFKYFSFWKSPSEIMNFKILWAEILLFENWHKKFKKDIIVIFPTQRDKIHINIGVESKKFWTIFKLHALLSLCCKRMYHNFL